MRNTTLGFLSERTITVGLALLWLCIQSALYLRYGVRFMGDSEGYILYAQNIAERFHFEQSHQLKYFGYPLFMALLFKFGLGLKGVVLAQIIISGVATIALYKTTRLLAGNWLAPALSTLLFIGWYEVQMYNTFILTESLYISLFIFVFYFLARAKGNLRQSLWALLVIFYICIVRPNGFIALVAYFGYIFTTFYIHIKSPLTRGALILAFSLVPVIAVVVVDQYLLTSFGAILDPYEKGHVIFMYEDLVVPSSGPILMPPADASPLAKISYFIQHNTSYFIRMAGLRFLLFWGNVKPFYSLLHNLIIVVVLYPLYFFTVRAIATNRIATSLSVFVVLLLLQQCFITTMTSEDWNGRFLMTLIAFVFIFGAIGLSWQLEKWRKKKPEQVEV
ncbi:glycosyltransferase family 39 protein [Pontibacter ruber]|uniref:Glycosyltransferase family 39 protein n=1 Tax=Pontibacter ruber TaxID=1343895 RepID=A0ABW5D2A8_9BACT|nr:glycosyltransferase family 39 protein [Pontibacter ruber]